MKILKDSVNDFFKWVKGTELVELDDIDVSEDPVRPELTLGFRISHDRKIFGLKYDNEIEAIICVAFCPEIPYNIERLVTLSPLTPMATHFHIKNGAKQIHINEETQNFEYEVLK
jgi:hypothetical protein